VILEESRSVILLIYTFWLYGHGYTSPSSSTPCSIDRVYVGIIVGSPTLVAPLVRGSLPFCWLCYVFPTPQTVNVINVPDHTILTYPRAPIMPIAHWRIFCWVYEMRCQLCMIGKSYVVDYNHRYSNKTGEILSVSPWKKDPINTHSQWPLSQHRTEH
jgi:hypothetical protein